MTQELIDKVWNKGKSAEDADHKFESTTDEVVPAKLYRTSRENTNMAWEVDHIFPKQILQNLGVPQDKIDDLKNLRPLQHSNNESKGTLYPDYTKVMQWDENRQYNVPCKKSVTVSDDTQRVLEKLYAPYLNGKTLVQVAKEYNKQ